MSIIADFTPKPMPVRDANAAVIDMDFNLMNQVVRGISNRLSALVSTVSSLPSSSGGSSSSGANPSVMVGLAAVNGVATTFLRSDGAPALSQSIAPSWTGVHTFAAASNVTQVIHKGFSGQTAALTKWIDSASSLLASVGISGRYYTANHLEVLDTFGAISSMAPDSVPTDCSTGLTYIYDTPAYVKTSLWTITNAPATVRNGRYACRDISTSGLFSGPLSTFDSTANAWKSMSLDLTMTSIGRGVFAGTFMTATDVIISSTNIRVQFQYRTSSGHLFLDTIVRDQASSTVTTSVDLGVIAASYTTTTNIKVTRPSTASGTLALLINGVSNLTGQVTALGTTGAIHIDIQFQPVGDYDAGANNAAKMESQFSNIQIIGDSMTDSCDIGANVDRRLITRQGTEIQIGENGGWTAIRSKARDLAVYEWLAGTRSLSTWSANGITNSVPVINSSNLTQTLTMNIGSTGTQYVAALNVEGTIASMTNATQYGIASWMVFPNVATTAASAIYACLRNISSAYTLTLGRGIFIDSPIKGALSTITVNCALDIATQTVGTTNYAIRTGAAGLVQIGGLTATKAVFTDGSKNLVSNSITGTGNVVMSASPTLTGTVLMSAATLSAILITATPTTATAMFRLPHGSAPTTPVNGDVWTTTAGIYVRINGATVGPLT